MIYSKAPITEATIDFCVILPEGFEDTLLDSFQADLGEGYKERQDLTMEEIVVDTSTNHSSHNSTKFGFRFVNIDKRRVVQASKNGFSYSILSPYVGWEEFSSEARTLWERYRSHINPLSVTRIGIRYINRLDVPLQSIELKEYLATFPEIAEGIPHVLNRYFMQLVIPIDSIKSTAIINQALVPPQVSGTTSIMLDIDLFRDQDAPQDEIQIWETLERLREVKNQIFNSTLTEKAKELIQ